MKIRSLRAIYSRALIAVCVLLAFFLGADAEGAEPLSVFAASSLTSVLPQVAQAWRAKGGSEVVFNFEATSRLAMQIEAGAPADVFFSADLEWMDRLEKDSKIVKGTRATLLGNEIVTIVPVGSGFTPRNSAELTDKRIEHLALAGDAVPAGKFARAALRSIGVWDSLANRIVGAENVRSALRWVAMGEAQAGIVFRTDANVDKKVRVAFVFDEKAHPPIRYPAAVVRDSDKQAAAMGFVEFCKGKEAQKIFSEAGFKTAVE